MLLRALRAWLGVGSRSGIRSVKDRPAQTQKPDPRIDEACATVRQAAEAGDLSRASTLMTALKASDPACPSVRWCEINLLWLDGQRPEAYEKCREEVARRPGEIEPLLLCGQFAQALGKHEQVIEFCSKALGLGVSNPNILSALASAYLAIGSTSQAHDCFARAVLEDPKHPVSLQNLGYMKAQFGLLDEASRLLSRAVELDPKLAEARINLATVLYRQHMIGEAVQMAHSALVLEPNNSRYLAEYAFCLAVTCQWDELAEVRRKIDARTKHEVATGIKPGSPPLLHVVLGLDPALQLAAARRFYG